MSANTNYQDVRTLNGRTEYQRSESLIDEVKGILDTPQANEWKAVLICRIIGRENDLAREDVMRILDKSN